MDPTEPVVDKSALIDQLAQTAANCPACGLCQTRTHVVFGVGNPGSPLMLVGEGPGANEDATGVPFVGRAGKLLDECLREAGMLRKHVYIANVVKCRATTIENGRLGNRPPSPEEIDACVPLWLEKQIAIIKPRVILCLGSPSAKTIIKKDFRIMQERGRWFESKYVRHAIAALHPAYILRQEGPGYASARQSLVDDLTAAKDRAKQAKDEPELTLF